MTETHIESPRHTLPDFCLGCGPMSSVYPLSVEESQATFQLIGQILATWLAQMATALRGSPRAASSPGCEEARGASVGGQPGTPHRPKPLRARRASTGSAWQLRLLHAVGLLIVIPLLPLLLITRLIPGQAKRNHNETIFAEANRSVLTAIDYALMV